MNEDIFNITKSTNERLLELLLERAIDAAEARKISDFVESKNAFSKKQALFLTLVASREPNPEMAAEREVAG